MFAGAQVAHDDAIARASFFDLVHRPVDEQPARGEERFVIGKQRPASLEELLEPCELGEREIDHDGVAEHGSHAVEIIDVDGKDCGEVGEVEGRFTAVAHEVADGLRGQPQHAVGERDRLGLPRVTDLQLATRSAPARIVAAPLRTDAAGACFDDPELLLVGCLEGAPEADRPARVAPIGRVPGRPVDQRAPLGVGLQRDMEVCLRGQHVTCPFRDDGRHEVREHAVGRPPGGTDEPLREGSGGGDAILLGVVGVDQLVEHSPAHFRVFQRGERLGEFVSTGVFVISDIERGEHVADQIGVVVRVMNPRDAPQTLVDAPQFLVMRDEAAPQLEAGVLEQLA